MLVGRWPDFVASPVGHTQQSATLMQAIPAIGQTLQQPTFKPNSDSNSNFAAVGLPLVKLELPFGPIFTIWLAKQKIETLLPSFSK